MSQSEARAVKVTCSGSPAHPYGMGVRLGGTLMGTRVGQYVDEYDYEGFRTDASAFVFSEDENQARLTFFDARVFRVPVKGFKALRLAEGAVAEVAFTYKAGMLVIQLDIAQSGTSLITK